MAISMTDVCFVRPFTPSPFGYPNFRQQSLPGRESERGIHHSSHVTGHGSLVPPPPPLLATPTSIPWPNPSGNVRLSR